MPIYSDKKLGKDIIEQYKKYRQNKDNYKTSSLKDKVGAKY
jgi:hypothetical protein